MHLSPDQLIRYDRNIRIAGFGEEAQKRLLAGRVTVVGAGGLGSPALYYLAAAGVGSLTVIDGDRVELSNLQRQILHRTADLGRYKVVTAAERIEALNPDTRVTLVPERLNEENITRVIRRADVVLDCTDNFETRFALADHCWREGLVLVSAAVLRFGGYQLTVAPGAANPCFRCFIPELPEPGSVEVPAQAGILGAVAGALGVQEAMEAIKLITGLGAVHTATLLIFDGLAGTWRTAVRKKDPDCAFCSAGGGGAA